MVEIRVTLTKRDDALLDNHTGMDQEEFLQGFIVTSDVGDEAYVANEIREFLSRHHNLEISDEEPV